MSADALLRARDVGLYLLACALVFVSCFYLPQDFAPERDLTIVPFSIAIGLAMIFKLSDRLRDAGLTVFLILLFACILVGRWHAGLTDGTVIAGRIPFSDASGYLRDAVALLDGSILSPFSSRRPIHVLVLAIFLKIANGQFAIASFLLANFTAIAIASLTIEIRRTHRSAAAFVFVLLITLYYRRFIGTALSEHAGLAFGCLGTALLWRGAGTISPRALCGGAFLLTIALVARAGCFFVLPPLILWIGWVTRGNTWLNWRTACYGAGAVAGGFVLNSMLLHIFGTPGSSFSNFPVTLYGMISGGDWQSFYAEHPDIAALPEAEAAPKIVAIVLERLQSDPWLLWHGAVRAWQAFFSTASGEFAFIYQSVDEQRAGGTYLTHIVETLPAPVAGIAEYLDIPHWPRIIRYHLYDHLTWTIFALGAVAVLARPKDARNVLMLACWTGILASIPFNPPWDSDAMRSYAATMPLQMITVAIGASAIQAYLTRSAQPAPVPVGRGGWFVKIAGLSIAAALLPILLAIKVGALRPSLPPPITGICAAGAPHLARAIPGTEVFLDERSSRRFALPPALFDAGLAKNPDHNRQYFDAFENLPSGTVLFAVTFLDSAGYNIVAVQDDERAAAFRQKPQPICVADGKLLLDERGGLTPG